MHVRELEPWFGHAWTGHCSQACEYPCKLFSCCCRCRLCRLWLRLPNHAHCHQLDKSRSGRSFRKPMRENTTGMPRSRLLGELGLLELLVDTESASLHQHDHRYEPGRARSRAEETARTRRPGYTRPREPSMPPERPGCPATEDGRVIWRASLALKMIMQPASSRPSMTWMSEPSAEGAPAPRSQRPPQPWHPRGSRRACIQRPRDRISGC